MVHSGNTFYYLQLPYGRLEVERTSLGGSTLFNLKVWDRDPETRRLKQTFEMDFTLDLPLTGQELVDAFAELDQERQRMKNAVNN
jgi:hypothetical protein